MIISLYNLSSISREVF